MRNYIYCLTKYFHTSTSNFIKRISKAERSKFKLDFYLKQVLIGNILGDVYMRRFSEKANVRIIFSLCPRLRPQGQGSINASYLLYLYSLFK